MGNKEEEGGVDKKIENIIAMLEEQVKNEQRQNRASGRIKAKIEGWIVKTIHTGEGEITTLLTRKMKIRDGMIVDKGRNAKYAITTSPILVNYKSFGIPCTKEVYLCDDKTGVTMDIRVAQDIEERERISWHLTSNLLSDMVDLDLFSQIVKQLKSPGGSILYLLLGLMAGVLIGMVFF